MRVNLADPAYEHDWQNATLDHFLEAMEAFLTDYHQPLPVNQWKFAAILLHAAKIYE